MSQYSEGSINVENGSQSGFGVFDLSVTGTTGSFSAGQTLAFSPTTAVGEVISWNAGAQSLKTKITSTAQPVVSDLVESVTASGQLHQFNFRPSFLQNVSAGDIFRVTTSGAIFYDIGSVPTRSKLLLGANYVGDTVTDNAYIVSTSFSPVHALPYPEPGDQQPTAVLKRSILDIDGLLPTDDITAVTGTFTQSLTISGVPVATGDFVDRAGDTMTGSLTITNGDLVVDTDTLFVDAGLDRVGIGTASPTSALDVENSTGPQIRANNWADISSNANGKGVFAGNFYTDNTGSTYHYARTHATLGALGVITHFPTSNKLSIVSSDTTSATQDEAFTPTSLLTVTYDGNVGIRNGSPTESLDVVGSGIFSGDLEVQGTTINFANLPTSSGSLNSGDLWRDLSDHTLKVTP